AAAPPAGGGVGAGGGGGPPLGASLHGRDFVDGQFRRGARAPPPPTVGDGLAHARVIVPGRGQRAI
ncbi:hypothetical protein, partial [Burkholderia pseudomallei]|uniref:hypothetical protein n=1 Tax=Burkholderia pseudomallei TaxID=28450 RepID=UPI001C4C7265